MLMESLLLPSNFYEPTGLCETGFVYLTIAKRAKWLKINSVTVFGRKSELCNCSRVRLWHSVWSAGTRLMHLRPVIENQESLETRIDG